MPGAVPATVRTAGVPAARNLPVATMAHLMNLQSSSVGLCLPAISDDRARSHKVRRDGKHRRQSRIGCAANHWRWLLRSRRKQ